MEPDNNMARFHVRNAKHFVDHVLPIFDKYPLLTSKYYYYDLFRQAALIISNQDLCTAVKNSLLTELKKKSNSMPENYISPT